MIGYVRKMPDAQKASAHLQKIGFRFYRHRTRGHGLWRERSGKTWSAIVESSRDEFICSWYVVEDQSPQEQMRQEVALDLEMSREMTMV
jgi:hypothetical protein